MKGSVAGLEFDFDVPGALPLIVGGRYADGSFHTVQRGQLSFHAYKEHVVLRSGQRKFVRHRVYCFNDSYSLEAWRRIKYGPPGTFQRIGANRAEAKRAMSQSEAARIVEQAKKRIALADAED
jgi:hypothetical protein